MLADAGGQWFTIDTVGGSPKAEISLCLDKLSKCWRIDGRCADDFLDAG